MKNESKPSKKQKEYARKILLDPILFASHVLGVSVWQKEAEILKSIKSNRRTAAERLRRNVFDQQACVKSDHIDISLFKF